jgi:hypothetical protein
MELARLKQVPAMRRVIECLLSPLLRYKQESLRER